MNYVYETHLHTTEGSACSNTPAIDYIDYMKGLGYSGVIVTDHFFNGNSAVPGNLPWRERIGRYTLGYEHMLKAAGDDFTVLFGVEYCFSGDEFLIYGIDRKWLMENPDIMEKDRKAVYDIVHESGAIMIQAHPFRERDYISAIHLSPDFCDGAEVYNAANPDWQNALAYEYAKEKNLRMTAGSDIHNFGLGNMGGMSFPHPVGSVAEFADAFLKGEGVPVYKRNVHDGRSDFRAVEEDLQLTKARREPTLEIFRH
ncbi:MAG: PHP domain-containing protein [Butyrivibrio sp.]|nr:PHP domain-containing protein [Butyrivibrio sp.]